MAALKIAREAGAHEQDNIDDAIGYLSMLNEVRTDQNMLPVYDHVAVEERKPDKGLLYIP